MKEQKTINYTPIKSILLLFIISLYSTITENHSYGQSFVFDPIERNVRIDIIDKVKDLHVIYGICLEDSALIVIVSKRVKIRIKNANRIKVGNTYKLSLMRYFERDFFLNHRVSFSIEYEGKKYLIQSKGRASNLYYSPDLRGLYIDTKPVE